MNQPIVSIDPIVLLKCPAPMNSLVKNAIQTMHLNHIDYFILYDFCEWEPQIMQSVLPAVILKLFDQQNNGSTCLLINDPLLIESINALIGTNAKEAIDQLIVDIGASKYKNVISTNVSDYLPLFLIERGGNKFLYTNKNWDAENKINRKIQLYKGLNSKALAFSYQLILDEILNSSHRKFNGNQKLAIELALKYSFMILTGGPGTGKTFTLTGILRAILRSGVEVHEIALAAPTAKAANRMNESIGENINRISSPTSKEIQLLDLKGTTIHRLLCVSNTVSDSRYSELYPMPFKVLVIDEASMIDLYLMKTLINSIDTSQTKLILIGDKDQLPSVEEGAVFSDLVENNTQAHVVTLKESYRTQGKLLAFIQNVNNKVKDKPISIPVFPSIDIFIKNTDEPVGLLELNTLSKEKFVNEIQFWAEKYFLELIRKFSENTSLDLSVINTYLKQISEAKILTVINNGLYGVDVLNQICRNEIIRSSYVAKSNQFFHGMPIQILRNNNQIELFNGDIGVIMKTSERFFQAVFVVHNQLKVFSIEKLPEFQLSFATTVHKGQGSEYENVMLIIPPESVSTVASKQLIYTGISRSKKKCLILAAIEDLQKSLDNDIKRTSGLRT